MAGQGNTSSAPAGIAPLETSASWIQCSFHVDGRPINASVKRFDQDERDRIAAEVAWFAHSVLTGAEPRAAGWPEFFQRMLAHNVTITLNDEGLDEATSFWHQVVCRMFEVLMIANGLDPAMISRMCDDYPPDGRYSH